MKPYALKVDEWLNDGIIARFRNKLAEFHGQSVAFYDTEDRRIRKRRAEIDNIVKDARLRDKTAGLFNSHKMDDLCSDVLNYVEIVALASRTQGY